MVISILEKAHYLCGNMAEKWKGKWRVVKVPKFMQWPYFITTLSHANQQSHKT
jgi:hypothetical protein